MEALLIVTNLFFLLFWVRLWMLPEQELYFNPFLSGPTRLTDRVVDFLRMALPFSGRLVCLLVLVFLLVFRGLALYQFAPQWTWAIRVGSSFAFVPHTPGLHAACIFSVLDLLFFVARLWGLYVLTQLLTPVLRRDRASEVLHVAALPLSTLQRWMQVLLLLLVHAGLIYELTWVGAVTLALPPGVPPPAAHPTSVPACHQLAHHAWLIVLSLADSLRAAQACLVAFFIGGFAALFIQNATLNAISNDGINVLLGRFARRIMAGLFDLTPIVYYFVLGGVYALVCRGVLAVM